MILNLVWTILFCFIWMSIFYGIYLLIGNAVIVDLGWTLCIGGVSLMLFYISGIKTFAAGFVFIAMMLWALRLTILIGYRLIVHKTDGRYEELDRKWAGDLRRKYFIFFMVQGLSVVIFTLPIMFVATSVSTWSFWYLLSMPLVAIGYVGVVLSDYQLQSFIKKPENRGQVCDCGLWGLSRHPNYFFEWVYWVGIFVFAATTSWGWISIISPISLLVTLLFFTGIPPSEERALKTKGEAYKAYQASTSAFVPWFKRR